MSLRDERVDIKVGGRTVYERSHRAVSDFQVRSGRFMGALAARDLRDIHALACVKWNSLELNDA